MGGTVDLPPAPPVTTSPPAVVGRWYARSAAEVAIALNVEPATGLSAARAQELLATNGPNALPEEQPKPIHSRHPAAVRPPLQQRQRLGSAFVPGAVGHHHRRVEGERAVEGEEGHVADDALHRAGVRRQLRRQFGQPVAAPGHQGQPNRARGKLPRERRANPA